VVQIKKIEVEQAILDASYLLFKSNGYSGTRMPQIAKAAGMSTANIYVYFDSKLDILIQIYENWFSVRLSELRSKVGKAKTPDQALKNLFVGMWKDLPAADNGFCGVLIEALSDRSTQAQYSPKLRKSIDLTLHGILIGCLPNANADLIRSVVKMLVMAFDGYALNYHLRNGQIASEKEIETLCKFIIRSTNGSTELCEL